MSKQYAPNELPKSLEIVIHTHYCYNSEYKWQLGSISHDTTDRTGDQYICLAKTPVHVVVETPGDLKDMVLKALEAEKQKQMAEHHKRMFELQEKIDSLLQLEYKPLSPDTSCDNDLPF